MAAIPASPTQHWWNEKTVAVVTGANKGIGFEIAKLLASQGLTTIATARDEGRGVEAAAKLSEAAGPSGRVVYHQLDIADKQSVERFATWLEHTYGGVTVLVNNAGMAFKGSTFGADEAQQTLDTNFFGTMQLCERLKPLLTKGNARIVNVSSSAGATSQIKDPKLLSRLTNAQSSEELKQLATEFVDGIRQGKHQQQGWSNSMYGVSKLLLSMYTRVLARELPDVMVNAICPGWCVTDMTSGRGAQTAAEGADTPVWLALRPPGDFSSGGFYRDRKQLPF